MNVKGKLMTRSIWFVATVTWLVASGSLGAQGRGQAGAEERVDWNAKMPWGVLEKAVQARWSGRPRTEQKTEPFKIFDNLYYVGVQHVASYIVPTGDGLILIDATYPTTADMVLDSIRRAGFDPAEIKYIVLTHAHFDHFGGIGRIKQVAPDARVVSTAADWDEIERQQAGANPDRGGLPLTRDMVVSDGQVLTLGNTTLTLHHAPGHSPGSLGIELGARDGERTYRLINPCVGLNNVPPDRTQMLIDSMERLKELGPWDGIFASHGFLAPRDPYISPRDFILGPDTSKTASRPHPALQGAAEIDAWFDHVLRVAREKLATEQAASN